MKKLALAGLSVCFILAFASCKSSESAYKKAYEKAKQQELAEPQVETVSVAEVTPVVTQPRVVDTPVDTNVRREKITVVSGEDSVKAYGVVCGSFGLKANAEGLKSFLNSEGYPSAAVVFNPHASMYRVIVSSYDTRDEAAYARDVFKSRYNYRKDFQEAWILNRIY